MGQSPQSMETQKIRRIPGNILVWGMRETAFDPTEVPTDYLLLDAREHEGRVNYHAHLVLDDLEMVHSLIRDRGEEKVPIVLLSSDPYPTGLPSLMRDGLRVHVWMDDEGHWKELLGVHLDRIAREVVDQKVSSEVLDTLRRRHELFRHAVTAARVGVWDWDLETNELHLEPNIKALLGYNDHEIRNNLGDWMRHIHPADYRTVMEVSLACSEGLESSYEVEYRVRHRDGSLRWLYVRGELRETVGRRRIVGATTDITPLKKAEEALLEVEKRYRAVVDVQSEMICRTRHTGKITFVNTAFARFWKTTPEKLIGRNLLDLLPENRQEHARNYLSSFSTRDPEKSELIEIPLHNGEKRWIRWASKAIFDEIGNLLEIQSVGRDVTEQNLAREETLRSEARLRQVLDLLPAFVLLVDRDYRVRYANTRFREIFGDPGDKPCHQLLHDSNEPCRNCRVTRAMESGEPNQSELSTPDGRSWVVHDMPYEDPEGGPMVLEVGLDITDQKEMVFRLEETRGRLHQIVGQCPIILFALDINGVFTLSEGAGLASLGLQSGEVIGKSAFEIYASHPAILNQLKRAFGGECFSDTIDVEPGRTFQTWYSPIVEKGGQPVGVTGVSLDITEWVRQTEGEK